MITTNKNFNKIKELKMNLEELLVRQLKLQNDLQEENNKLLREILKVLLKN